MALKTVKSPTDVPDDLREVYKAIQSLICVPSGVIPLGVEVRTNPLSLLFPSLITKTGATIKFWDLRTAKCLHNLQVNPKVCNISFDNSGSYFNSNIGPIAVPDNVHTDGRLPAPHTLSRSNNLIGLSEDGEWITRGFENFVWLPSDYRPWFSNASERTIAIVNEKGLFMLAFD